MSGAARRRRHSFCCLSFGQIPAAAFPLRSPVGATCPGSTLPPVARPGYAILPLWSETPISEIAEPIFAKCKSGCIGGQHFVVQAPSTSDVVVFNSTVYRCDRGYQDRSALCSICDRGLNFAKNGDGACEECRCFCIIKPLVCAWDRHATCRTTL